MRSAQLRARSLRAHGSSSSSLEATGVEVLPTRGRSGVLASAQGRFRFPEDFPQRGVESLREPLQGIELQVLLTPLDCAVVGAVHADLVGKAFLAETERFPALPEGQAETLGQGRS